MSNVRWGILGAGNIARSFAQDINRQAGMELSAVGSRSKEKAEQFGSELNIPGAYDSYEKLIADQDVDVVYIATPHVFHLEQSLLCLDAGKPILVEKPFMMNAEETAEVVTFARKKGLFCMEAMWMRFIPTMREAVKLITSGAIGEIQMISASLGYYNDFDSASRLFNPNLGGGAMLDLGVYPLSLIVQLLGRPLSIQARASIGASKVDEHTACMMQFQNGAIAQFSANLQSQNRNDAFIIGSLGTLHIHQPLLCPASFTLTSHPINASKTEDTNLITSHLKSNKYVYKAIRNFRGGYLRIRGGQQIKLAVQGNGLGYEAKEVERCLRNGLLESEIMPLDESQMIMEIMDEIQRQYLL